VRKFVLCAVATLAFAMTAFAQDVPKGEIFGGYSYYNADISNTQAISGDTKSRINLNGWNGELTGYFNNFFGITADISGHYGSPTVGSASLDTKVYNFLFGPQVAFRSERATVFGRALFGAAKTKADVPNFGNVYDDTSFAWGFGGGIDIGMGRNFAIRPAQFDYIRTNTSLNSSFGLNTDNGQNNFRYSAGIVFRF
jgi:opacity protein-like surface antigen